MNLAWNLSCAMDGSQPTEPWGVMQLLGISHIEALGVFCANLALISVLLILL